MSKTEQVVRLLLIDDHAMFRDGVARVLEKEMDFVVVGQAASATDALAQLQPSGATLVLLDVDLGAERALDFVHGARAAGSTAKILVVTAGISDQEAFQLIQSGVAGILHKHQSSGALCSAIRQVANGEVYLEQTYLTSLFRTLNRSAVPAQRTLTERDKTIMRLLLHSLTNKEIAARLQISEGAVKASVHYIYQKLGVRTRAQLVKVTLEQFKHQLG